MNTIRNDIRWYGECCIPTFAKSLIVAPSAPSFTEPSRTSLLTMLREVPPPPVAEDITLAGGEKGRRTDIAHPK